MWMAWKLVQKLAIEIALGAALKALLEVAEPLFKKVADALEEAACFVGDKAVWLLISALEELANLATNLARKAEDVDDSEVAAEVAKAARKIAREANEMARKLRNLKKHDVASRVMLRKEAQNAARPQHFGMVPKVQQSQENMYGRVQPGARGASRVPSHMFGPTFNVGPGAQRVSSSHANMGTFMAQPGALSVSSHGANMGARTYMGAHGVPRGSSHGANMGAGTYMGAHGVPSHGENMGTGTYMPETGASEAELMIREVEEAARKLKAKVVDTHTIPAGQNGGKIQGAQSLTCF